MQGPHTLPLSITGRVSEVSESSGARIKEKRAEVTVVANSQEGMPLRESTYVTPPPAMVMGRLRTSLSSSQGSIDGIDEEILQEAERHYATLQQAQATIQASVQYLPSLSPRSSPQTVPASCSQDQVRHHDAQEQSSQDEICRQHFVQFSQLLSAVSFLFVQLFA